MQCPPGTPQLRCRPINQPRNLVIKLGQVWVLQSVFPATVWTEPGRRLARVLASRSIVGFSQARRLGDAVDPAALLFGRGKSEPELFLQRSREDAANGMALPAGHARHLVDRCTL